MEKTASHKLGIALSALRGSASWLAILGAAFYWSWMDNAMFSDLLFTVFRDDPATANLANICFSCTLLTSAVVLLVALFFRMPFFEVKSHLPLKVMGILGGVGALGSGALMASGAYGFDALGIASAVLVGATMGFMQILWGKVCIAQGHRRALVHISGAWACGFFLNALIENLVPLTRGLFVVALPLLTAAAFIVLGRLQSYPLYSLSTVSPDACDPLQTAGSKRSSLGVDWRLPLFTLIFCVAFGFMYSIEVFPTTADNPASAFQFIAFRGFTALTLFIISLTPLVAHISTVFVACLSLMAAGVLALTVQVFTGTTQTLGATLIATGYAGFDALIWTLIAYYGNQSKNTATKIIALVIGAEQVGIFTGNLLGSSIINHAVDATLFIAFMYLFLLAAFGLTQLCSKVLGTTAAEASEGEVGNNCESVRESEGEICEAIGNEEVSKLNSVPSSSASSSEPSLKPQVVPAVAKAPAALSTTAELTATKSESPYDALIREYGLTAREQEILLPFCEGRSVPYIAKMLFLSENTVKSHLRHIYTKCEVHNKQALLDLVRDYQKGE